MSPTLFRYIFGDLVKIFVMALGVLSAIMSFGGLLKPLYEVGLNLGQVFAILGYSTPAMNAYALPIAALFATTIVYGRLGADNEITACRAAGISHLALAKPAFVLGFISLILSLLLLCFVVPASMLKVEKVIYSNLAQLAAGQIERTHQVKFDPPSGAITIFAQSAQVLPIDPNRPRNQALEVNGALFVHYVPKDPNDRSRTAKIDVPKDFFMARQAIAYIQQDNEDDDVMLSVDLLSGSKFPRTTQGGGPENASVSIVQQRIGPFPVNSPLRENTKFMDIFRLQNLLVRPEFSRRIGEKLREFIRRDQEREFLKLLASQLNESADGVELGLGDEGRESYHLFPTKQPAEVKIDRLVLTGSAQNLLRFEQTKGLQSLVRFSASTIRIRAFPNTDRRTIELEVELLDSISRVGNEEPSPPENRLRSVTVKMPDSILALTTRPVDVYLATLSEKDKADLQRNLLKQDNSIKAEMHARLSFALSCFILVMVGCALGMMFRSGNFLSAFAVSVIPALLCIALIVTGQHTCENVPSPIPPGWTNPYVLGIALIWSGNVAVFVIAGVLLGRLQRQ